METPQVCSQFVSAAREGIKDSPLLSAALCLTVGALAMHFFAQCQNTQFKRIANALDNLAGPVTLAGGSTPDGQGGIVGRMASALDELVNNFLSMSSAAPDGQGGIVIGEERQSEGEEEYSDAVGEGQVELESSADESVVFGLDDENPA